MRFRDFCSTVVTLLALASSAPAATFYVGPSGSGGLSTDARSPGSLGRAVADAPRGSTVILEDGTYDGAPSGFTVAVPAVTFRAQHWHGAIVTNSAGAYLWGPDPKLKPTGDVCQGIVFGPCATPASGGWSGGGGDGWQFLDCEFTRNDGVGFGNDSLVLHCLFTDAWMNSFDVDRRHRLHHEEQHRAARQPHQRRLGLHRQQRTLHQEDDDRRPDRLRQSGHRPSGSTPPTQDWVVKNCTLFANHGGNNWYTLGVSGGRRPDAVPGERAGRRGRLGRGAPPGRDRHGGQSASGRRSSPP